MSFVKKDLKKFHQRDAVTPEVRPLIVSCPYFGGDRGCMEDHKLLNIFLVSACRDG